MVDVLTQASCTTILSGSVKFHVRLLEDGSQEFPFAIPDGDVFVVTSVELQSAGGTAGTYPSTRLYREGATTTATVFATRQEPGVRSDGRLLHLYEFPGGIVVGNGVSLCADVTDSSLLGSLSGIAHGYFTKDK
jgi:hypothetical protein